MCLECKNGLSVNKTVSKSPPETNRYFVLELVWDLFLTFSGLVQYLFRSLFLILFRRSSLSRDNLSYSSSASDRHASTCREPMPGGSKTRFNGI